MLGRIESFRKFIVAALTSKRSYGSLVVTGLSSISNFILSIVIARSGSVAEVASFAIGFAGFITISGISRAMVGEPSSARLLPIDSLRQGGQQVSCYGLILAVVIFLLGLLTGQPYLMAVGISGHAIALYDYSKLISTVFGNPQIAVITESIRAISIIGIAFIPTVNDKPFLIFVIWLLTMCVASLIGILIQRIRILPTVGHAEIPFKESISYSFDYILGGGTSQAITFALGAFASPAVNASIRGAGTLFGPITMIATSVRALLLKFLSRRLFAGSKFGPPIHVSLSLLIAAIPLLIVVNLLPNEWGHSLLGETWLVAKEVMPYLSIEVISTMLTTIPFSGHRSLGAHKRVFKIRLSLALLRLPIVIGAGILGGHMWAAIAMVTTSVLELIVWWTSYTHLMKAHTVEG